MNKETLTKIALVVGIVIMLFMLVSMVTGLVKGKDIDPATLGGVYNHPTGVITADLTGDVTGDVVGDVTGDLTGDVTGDITGDGVLTTSTITNLFVNNGTDCTKISFDGSTTTPTYATSTCP